LVTQQDAYAQSLGQIGQGLVQVYRALGGGWEIRFSGAVLPMAPMPLPPVDENAAPQPAPEEVAKPNPNIPPVPADIPKPPEQVK
jgi:hypothetical protein